MAPKINPDTPKKYKVRKGEDVEIVVKFSATPKPNDEWTVNGHVVTKSKRVMPSIDEESAILTIRKIQEEDVGDYTLKLVNNVGEASIEINVVIVREYPMFFFPAFFFFSFFEIKIKQSCFYREILLLCYIFIFIFIYVFAEVPSAPDAPEPLEITENSVTLHWKKPDSNGNSPIVEYILEHQEKTETT